MEKKADSSSIIFRRSCDAHALISDSQTSSQLHATPDYTTLSECYPPACTCWQVVLHRAMPKATSVPSVLDPRCPSRLVLDRIADKWTALTIQILSGGTMRYAALQREIGGISQKMLTQTLRSLEREAQRNASC